MKIQNSLFIIFVVHFTLFADYVWSADWIYFASSAARDSYYDKSTIQNIDKNIMSVRTKQILNAKGNNSLRGLKDIETTSDNFKLISYILKSSEIDCLNKKIKDSSVVFYDEKSSLLYSSPKGEMSKWDDIISGSVAEKLSNIVCNEVQGEQPAMTKSSVIASPGENDKNMDPVTFQQSEIKSIAVEDIRKFLDKWLNSWKSGDMKTYRSCYDENFEFKKMKLDEWIAYKMNVNNKSKNINILIDDLKISTDGDNATAVFTQIYSSSIVKDKGRKTLELKRAGNEWKIFREIM